jgi:hypothetical protein
MAAKTEAPPIIYNLFPRLFRTIDDWTDYVEKIAEMNFNSVYVNPFHEVGGSKSMYAVKDYYRLNADFLPSGAKTDDFTPLKKFADACKEAGIEVYMDLVINHTANESPLISKHPKWFKRNPDGTVAHPYAIDPGNPGSVTVWGDLSEIEFDDNPDFDGMMKYWDDMVAFYQKLGINGFRCDAAYKIPRRAWEPLIKNARKRSKGAKFLAESLGCTVDQTLALNGCGFDYLFNSSKWWNFEGPWCLDQHDQFRHIAPSISFPESHDTTRLAADQPGTLEMQKNRYVLSAIFSKGLMMTLRTLREKAGQRGEYAARGHDDVAALEPDELDQQAQQAEARDAGDVRGGPVEDARQLRPRPALPGEADGRRETGDGRAHQQGLAQPPPRQPRGDPGGPRVREFQEDVQGVRRQNEGDGKLRRR